METRARVHGWTLRVNMIPYFLAYCTNHFTVVLIVYEIHGRNRSNTFLLLENKIHLLLKHCSGHSNHLAGATSEVRLEDNCK